jgi:uncharacterized Ntn-hydrolase superfamily protein
VARDSGSGQLGVAVQSHWFSVGSVVSWAESGVGAVATQSLADPAYGPLGLELMRAGRTPEEALRSLLAGDEGRDGRQVCFLDAAGRIATHTGSGCIAEAGHVTGDQFSVQANMMARPTVWDAMAEAYRSAAGDLTERLIVALEAAEGEGGDIRGKQSAALLVVSGQPTGRPWIDRIIDVRIEDHPEPLSELRRLVRLRRAYLHMTEGDDAIGAGDLDEALRQYGKAEALVPEIVEMPFWKAVTLAGTGHVEQALPIFQTVFDREPGWRELLPRVIDAGLLEIDEKTLDRILG